MMVYCSLLLLLLAGFHLSFAQFLIGRGIADATGVIAEGVLYGYANPGQDARGLHLRQFSRAFIIVSSDSEHRVVSSEQRVVLVIVEATMVSQSVRTGVHEKLREVYGDMYSEDNVMLLPTHSHSCPGGFHAYLMYAIPSLFYVPQTYDAFVNGIVESIRRAHNDLQSGSIYMNYDELLDTSINRSPASYDNNPETERAKYRHDVDKDMTLLRFVDVAGEALGLISFFPVHTTSMKKTNHLLSTDNKGYAAQMMERYLNPGSFPGQAEIPAAFAQTAVGDVTPNIGGALCEGTDEACGYVNSSCPEAPRNPTLCTGRGPDGDEFEDTRIIGEKQFLKAKELFEASASRLSGDVHYVHTHVNMPGVTVKTDDAEEQLCSPAMGFSFGAGATDGPGTPPFIQGDTEGIEELLNFTQSLVPYPEEYAECHQPKPILLPTGHMPPDAWPWQPSIVPLQIFRIGDLVLIGMPAEITTMSGRRAAERVRKVLVEHGFPPSIRPLVLSMANGYVSYVTTREEYMVQRYEGASTIFGPNTLEGYIQELEKLAVAMATGSAVGPGPTPPDLRHKPIRIRAPKIDSKPRGETFGQVLSDVNMHYSQGEQVAVVFRSGNPRHDIKTGSTYLQIEQQHGDGTWSVSATDAFWETKLFWSSDCHDVGSIIPPIRCLTSQTSNVTVTWDIPANQESGIYRIVHQGSAKSVLGGVKPYMGTSSPFTINISAKT